MKHGGNPKLPVKRPSPTTTDEELAARDFAVDFMFDEDFSEFFCVVDEGDGDLELGNSEYLRMVLRRRKGWVLEPGCGRKGGGRRTR